MNVADHGSDVASLRALIDSLPALIHTGRPDGYLDFFNRRWLEFVGLRFEELEGWKWTSAVHADDVAALVARWRVCLASGEPLDFEARVRRADGEYRWMLHQKVAVRDESGHIAKWYGTSIDIEDRKEAEQKLRQDERELHRVIDTIPSLAWSTLPDGSGEFWNKRWYDYSGLTPEECSGSGWHRSVHPEDVTPLMNKWAEVLASGQAGESEARFRRHDGVFRWFLIRAEPLREETGKIVRWYGISTDIEDRKQAEEKLRQDECELRQITDAIPQTIIVQDPDGKPIYANKAMLDYAGLTIEDVSRPDFRALIAHPDDFERLRDKRRAALLSGLPFENEVRGRSKDGQYRWFLAQYSPFRDEQGRLVRWYVTGTDIEDRKQAEVELRRSESFLLEAQSLSHAGSWRFDLSSKTVAVSPEISRIFGIKPEENYQTAEFFFSRIHPADRPDEERNYARALSAKADFESNYRIVLPDGTIKHVHHTGHAVLSERGDLVEFVGTVVDVTQQWQARVKLEKALEEIRRLRDRLHDENLALREEIDHASMFEEIVGSSDAIRRVLGQVAKVAPTDSTVLISGETGTGKELIARAIHKRSNRSARAFIRVNCGAIPSSLIASELFGHEKGAFTGAFQRRIGYFEAADGGTILLDEIGDLPMEMQSTLLRVLQEEEFQRVGSSQSVSVDVRVLAATNRDLRSAVAAGKFREDLFYRLNVFPVRLPPLRERLEDISLLVEYLITRYAQKAGKKFREITSNTLELFQAYSWPGNIRELQNVIERAVVLCDGDTFSVDESWLRQGSSPASGPVVPLVTTLEDRKRQMIEAALAQTRGRISGPTGAAAKLGIPRQTLDRKILGLGIDKSQFKSH
jgi:PAS domain S-box-containing protein